MTRYFEDDKDNVVFERCIDVMSRMLMKYGEYYGAAEPPVRCGESHLSGLTEPLRSL